jgi:tyrosyl-tRNA synthetase
MPLLRGTDGEQKMSKSYGNYIGLTDSAEDMFGKTMSIPDELLEEWYELASLLQKDELEAARRRIRENPYQAKRALGRIIASTYHGVAGAEAAEAHFDRLFKEKSLPDEMAEIELQIGNPQLRYKDGQGIWAAGLLVASGLAASNSEAVRLIEQGGIAVDEQRIAGRDEYIGLRDTLVIRRGKRQFVRVRLR